MRIGDRYISLKALHMFEAVARNRNMRIAADELSVTQSAVSRQMKQLEAQVGQPLFDRSKKPLHLTVEGRHLYEVAGDAMEVLKLGVHRLQGDRFTGELTVALPPSFMSLCMAKNLPGFLERYPRLDFKATLMPARPQEILPQADIVVQYGKMHRPGKRVQPLAKTNGVVVCSPALVEGQVNLSPEILSEHTLIHEDDGETWTYWLTMQGWNHLNPGRHIYVDKAVDAIALAQLNAGFALIDDIYLNRELAAGSLIQPFRHKLSQYETFYLVTDPEEKMSMVARDFEAWLKQETAVYRD